MNASYTRPKFMDRFRGHLPEILYTNVPLPSFMETPLSLDMIFGAPKNSRKRTQKAKPNTPQSSSMEGELSVGKTARFALDGKDLEIDNGTWIVGNLEFGAVARVKGRVQGEKLYVSQLVILKPKSA